MDPDVQNIISSIAGKKNQKQINKIIKFSEKIFILRFIIFFKKKLNVNNSNGNKRNLKITKFEILEKTQNDKIIWDNLPVQLLYLSTR